MHDATDILDRCEIDALRRTYNQADESAIQAYATKAAAALFVEGREFVMAVRGLLYDPQIRGIEAIDREIQLLTIFTICGERAQLAVHIYWALMCGLAPNDIATTILLASLRAGIDEYVAALATMKRVFDLLKKLASLEPRPEDVIVSIQQAFI